MDPAGGVPNPAFVGVVPIGTGRAPIGGAPLPLLRTEEGTFLERALTLLRGAGAVTLLVVLDDDRGPVAAAARRHGARVIAPRDVTDEGARALAGAADPSPSPGPLLFLSPAHVLVQPRTLSVLLEAAGSAPEGMRLLVPHGEGMDDPALAWWRRSPLLLTPGGAGREHRDPAGGTPALAPPGPPPSRWGEGVQAVVQRLLGEPGEVPVPILPVPMSDPGVALSVDTLTLYRRHFPGVFRKRFQKW